jgi:hypothetical protein
MTKIHAPTLEHVNDIASSFIAGRDETFFIWLNKHGEEEAIRRWKRCCKDAPIPKKRCQNMPEKTLTSSLRKVGLNTETTQTPIDK